VTETIESLRAENARLAEDRDYFKASYALSLEDEKTALEAASAAIAENTRLERLASIARREADLAGEIIPELQAENTRLWGEVKRMGRALCDAAALVESARVLAVCNGNAASERAFEAGVASARASAQPRAASDKSPLRQPPAPSEESP